MDIERSDEDLTQQALTLKREGRSVRQIAEALGISPSKAHRLTKLAEEAGTEGETLSDTLAGDDVRALERAIAHALQSEDTERLTVLLSQVQEQETAQNARLAELHTAHAAAEHRLTDATTALNRRTDRLERIPLEEAKAEARADYIEATTTLAHAEQGAYPFATLSARVRARLREIETQRQEAQRAATLAEAKNLLERAQAAFLMELSAVEEKAAVVGEAITSDMPLTTLRELVGALRLGGVPARGLHEIVRVKFLRTEPVRNFAPGDVLSTDWVNAREWIWQGMAEEL